MNQIINLKNKKKHKYIIVFLIFIIFTLAFSFILLKRIYNNYSNRKISNILSNSYSVSTLYADSDSRTISSMSKNPFIIGIIKIDKLKLNYSILSECNDELLELSVCRFAGPMPNEVGNLCIAGHNYVDSSFFGRLDELEIDDEIKIYDLSGYYSTYSIYEIYQTNSDDTSCTFQNTNNQKIITLLTCNNISGKRLVIHAKEKNGL